MNEGGLERPPNAAGSAPPNIQDPKRIAAVHAAIAAYYTFKLAMHGPTPRGVDWSCAETQDRRFSHLLKLCDFSSRRTLNDIGCGYGALLSYLERCHADATIDYLGTELSGEMILHAKRLWKDRPQTQFLLSPTIPRVADYCVGSGIFNVQQEQANSLWEYFVSHTLDEMHRCSLLGFAVNFIAEPVDGRVLPSGLYWAPMERWIDYFSAKVGLEIEIINDDQLGEFTLLVRKSLLTDQSR